MNCEIKNHPPMSVCSGCKKKCPIGIPEDYGYVNPGGQEAVINELVYRFKAYQEAKVLMKRVKNLSLVVALNKFAEGMVFNG